MHNMVLEFKPMTSTESSLFIYMIKQKQWVSMNLSVSVYYGDQYRIKVKSSTYETECIFYWDPEDVQLARPFAR